MTLFLSSLRKNLQNLCSLSVEEWYIQIYKNANYCRNISWKNAISYFLSYMHQVCTLLCFSVYNHCKIFMIDMDSKQTTNKWSAFYLYLKTSGQSPCHEIAELPNPLKPQLLKESVHSSVSPMRQHSPSGLTLQTDMTASILKAALVFIHDMYLWFTLCTQNTIQ